MKKNIQIKESLLSNCMNQHDHDVRSLAWHKHIVICMRDNPVLLKKAKTILNRWLLRDSQRSLPYLLEWKRILDSDITVIASIACDEGEKSTALRQCSPLSCVLPNQERLKFWRSWRDLHEKTRT